MIKCSKKKWVCCLGYCAQAGKLLRDFFYLVSIPCSEKPEPQKMINKPKKMKNKPKKGL